MRQVLQNLKTGATELLDVPCPQLARGHLLIRTARSLISAGTERMVVDFSNASLLEKARQQPDKVKLVLNKIKTDGLVATLDTVQSKLDQGVSMGYCNVGTVADIGADGRGYVKGDRVVSNGRHAEIVSVPVNLCARIPDSVADDEAAFTVIGAIALQGIRLAQPGLGERVVVIGLGMVGLMTVQLLRASGCRILGVDKDPARLALAGSFGAEVVNFVDGDPVAVARNFSANVGVDSVLITAATDSNEPVHQAASMCRKRGRIVLVGVAGLQLSRADFYEKELTFQVSCSYGPGRYDPQYEEAGHDYPIGFVRWTEQRNFEAILEMLAAGKLDVRPLISHRFGLDEAEKAYHALASDPSSLGILLEYAGEAEKPDAELQQTVIGDRPSAHAPRLDSRPTVGVIGAGSYANKILIPAFKRADAELKVIASYGGFSGAQSRRRFGFTEATSDAEAVLTDETIDAVVIATRHDSHASLCIRALESGKHVFVEKPLCLRDDELTEIESAYRRSTLVSDTMGDAVGRPLLMVGFNRRFAPHVAKIKSLLAKAQGPKSFVMTVNAGALPQDHWTLDPEIGGGRIIGEACHFIDLLRFLAGSPLKQFERFRLGRSDQDTVSLQLAFEDGSIGTVHYFANGSNSYPKEKLEIFSEGRVLQLDNYRVVRSYGWPGFNGMRLWRQDKGQAACAAAFIASIRNSEASPIAAEELFEVSRVAIALGR